MRDDLAAAYRATHYWISAPAGELSVRVGQRSDQLAALLQSLGAGEAALLTAFNPRSEIQSGELNRVAQDRLLAELGASGYRLLPARNVDPSGQWPVEESLLVLGMDLAAARDCAVRYGQVAFLWTDAAATPQLIQAMAG
jgi:hypothetical protein